MYQLFRNNRRVLKNNIFNTYEEARQALRRHIRKLVNTGKASRDDFVSESGWAFWDSISRNPTNFTKAGFAIRKAA
jgi:predicted component of type VI protein secretion system